MKPRIKLRRLSTRARGFDARLAALTRYEAAQDANVARAVRSIIAAVRTRGDAALLEYSRRFDRVRARSVAELEVSPREMRSALKEVSGENLKALRAAAGRIRRFHEIGRAHV